MKKPRAERKKTQPAGLVFLVLSLLGLRAPAPCRQVEDCVAAVVDGKAVTLVDVRIARRFGLHAGDPAEASLSAVLDRLVEQKLVFDLARGPSSPSDEEIAAALGETAGRLGPEAWARALAEFGMVEADLRPFVEETIGYRKALAGRFSQAAPVTIKEIEAYYQDVYVPGQQAAGEEPAPMVQVLDRIESRVQERKRDELIAEWTGNLKAQAEIFVNRDCLE
jgi:hypothetical protein